MDIDYVYATIQGVFNLLLKLKMALWGWSVRGKLFQVIATAVAKLTLLDSVVHRAVNHYKIFFSQVGTFAAHQLLDAV